MLIALAVAAPTSADQLATLVTLTGSIPDYSAIGSIAIMPGIYGGIAPAFALNDSQVGIAHDFPTDFWSFDGFAAGYGFTAEAFTAYFGHAIVHGRLDQSVGNYYFAWESPDAQILEANVSRLLPLPNVVEFPSPYTSATWTLDAVIARPDMTTGLNLEAVDFQFTGRYYIAPEPASFVMLIGCVHAIALFRRRYLPRFLM